MCPLRAGASPPPDPETLTLVVQMDIEGLSRKEKTGHQESLGVRKAGLAPQRGCPAGDPALPPRFFLFKSPSRLTLQETSSGNPAIGGANQANLKITLEPAAKPSATQKSPSPA